MDGEKSMNNGIDGGGLNGGNNNSDDPDKNPGSELAISGAASADSDPFLGLVPSSSKSLSTQLLHIDAQLRRVRDARHDYDLDEEELKEFAEISSPKVSELLNEQALALDHLFDTPGWSSSDDDDQSDDYDCGEAEIRGRSGGGDHVVGRRRDGIKGGRRKKRDAGDDIGFVGDGDGHDEDSMEEEWSNLEATQMDLRSELDAATNGFAQMLYGNDDGDYGGDYKGHSQEENPESNNDAYGDEWRDSIHQYYNQSTVPTGNGTTSRRATLRPGHSYSLADHALALDVSRPPCDGGLYTKPVLSRNELETLGIVTMPGWIVRPSGGVSSHGRDRYMKRMLGCATEYIEPPRPKHLKRMFSGWSPGPGERKPEDDGGERVVAGSREGTHRVTAYRPANSPGEDSDSSFDDDEERADHFEDIGPGMAYATKPRKALEPLPVRTVAVRIRPDVLCGAVMDALTTSVEGAGGEMTKRQGGHLRAVLPGRRVRAWLPGEWERERRNANSIDDDGDHLGDYANGGEGLLPSPANDAGCHQPLCVAGVDDASIASGLSTILSPILGGPGRPSGPRYTVLPPFIVDAQLVTKKAGKECQRLVLIRIYRVQDVARARSTEAGGDGEDEEATDAIVGWSPLRHQGSGCSVEGDDGDGSGDGGALDPLPESNRSLGALREASALVQRIKAVGGAGFAIDPPPLPDGDVDDATISSHTSTKSYLRSFGDAITSPIRYLSGNGTSPVKPSGSSSRHAGVMELMSAELLQMHVPSPSVGTRSRSALAAARRSSNGIFPSLSGDDLPHIRSSWTFLRGCVEELDRRWLAYSTLGIRPIFQFPALPTLDVHFIAQIKAFCRESMIASLVKTASELEVYAREFEVSCGNVDQLLRPTFEMYELAPPQLPLPVPLTAYPLDFRAPEEVSPPWGPAVMSALEKLSNELVVNSTGIDPTWEEKNCAARSPLTSFERSEKATSIVVAAFQKQNDVEQGARLGRKNMQVMDRLAKMQAHKRGSIARIRDSYGESLPATRAADQFHSLRRRASNVGSLSDAIHATPDEVPLLSCNVLVGNAAGTCHVTNEHVLFSTQLVPILGGNRVHLFSIMDVDVTINAPSRSVLNPLPASISLTTAVFGGRPTTREEVYNFIPSIGARRFAKFLEVLREIALEDPDSLKFSEKGGLIYLAD